MADKTYLEKLKDPRWQKKRLEILNRDNWRCRACEADDEELHVHHISYITDDPWDEDNDNLVTLCSECHKTWHTIYDTGLHPEYVYGIVDLYTKIEAESINRYFREHPKNS
mgnify:CR=1 FL=1